MTDPILDDFLLETQAGVSFSVVLERACPGLFESRGGFEAMLSEQGRDKCDYLLLGLGRNHPLPSGYYKSAESG